MEFGELIKFIEDGQEKWERLKDQYKNIQEMRVYLKGTYLKGAYLVVMFDHYQLDISLVKKLYKETSYADVKKPTRDEQMDEAYRKQMVAYFENALSKVSIEVRFKTMRIDLIQKLRADPLIMNVNKQSSANITVVIAYIDVERQTGLDNKKGDQKGLIGGSDERNVKG